MMPICSTFPSGGNARCAVAMPMPMAMICIGKRLQVLAKLQKETAVEQFIYGLVLPGLLVSVFLWRCGSSGLWTIIVVHVLVILASLYSGLSRQKPIESKPANSIRAFYMRVLLCLGKLPEAQGVLHYYLNKASG